MKIAVMNFPDRFKKTLQDKGLSVYRVAKDIKKPVSTVRSWANGLAIPRDKNMDALADYLEVHPAWLKYGTKEYAKTKKDSIMKITQKIEKYLTKHPNEIDKIEKFVKIITDE